MTITELKPHVVASRRVLPASGAAYQLSALLALVSVAAAGITFFIPTVLLGPPVMNGSARGTALVVLVCGVPVLLIAMRAAVRGSVSAVMVLLGTLGYLLYNAVMFAFATPFNRLFLVYMAMLSLALWSVIALVSRVDRAALRERIRESMPVRGIAIYLWTIVALNTLVWLRGIVPALFAKAPGDLLAGTGLPTNPVYVQDLAFWLALYTVAGVWLWRRQTWGFFTTGAVLIMWLLESVGVAIDQRMGHMADPASTVASGAAAWMFAALAVVGAVPAILFYRNVSEV